MKFLRYIVTICCICSLFTGCSEDRSNNIKSIVNNSNQSTDAELYEAGLELISVMDEMIRSDEYAKIFFNSTTAVESVLETVDTNDYDSPTAVYRITMPKDIEIPLNLSVNAKIMWNDLSDNLKKQLKNRFSFSTIPTMINSPKGSSFIAFSSAYHAFDTNEEIIVNEPTTLLYVFEKGTPIAVTFTKHGDIQGQFVFLDNANSSSTVKSTFRKYKCSVSKLYFY